jgi:hypothetical protein
MPGLRYALNTKEQTVLASLPSPKGDDKTGEYLSLEDIAKKAFGDQKRGSAPKSKGNSWVRNSMRKLLALKLVNHAPGKSGKYARTLTSLVEIEEKEAARLASMKKKGDEAKTRTKAGKAAKAAKPAKAPKSPRAKKAKTQPQAQAQA